MVTKYILYGLELLISSSWTGIRNYDIRRKMATQKQHISDQLKMFMKYFCQNKYNLVKTDVPEKHTYWVSQYDELLAVLVQIYKIRIHRSDISQDK